MANIPKNFHFVFGLIPQTEPFHLMHYLCLKSCMEVNQPDKVFFHYQNLPYGEWWDLISPKLTLRKITDSNFVKNFTYSDKSVQQYQYAHISDIIRLEALLEFGGVYADMDTLFVNKIPDQLYYYPCVMGEEKVDWNEPLAKKAGGSLCNALIMAEPGAKFLRIWLENMTDFFNGSWSAHSTFLPYLLSKENKHLIHIEPKRSFFHFDWDSKGINDIFVNQASDTRRVYSIHLWSHLWWNPRRTDFSYFNHKLLTVHYVAFATTTYARIAKRFLPVGKKLSRSNYQLNNLRLAISHGFAILKSIKNYARLKKSA